MNTSVTRKDNELDMRFCEGRIEIITINFSSKDFIQEWNHTSENFRIFSYPCIADLNGDGRNDFLVAIQDDPNHYLNTTEIVAFISKNYEEERIASLKDFFVFNINFANISDKNILLAGYNPKKDSGKIIVLEGETKIWEYSLGNRTSDVVTTDVNRDGSLDFIVSWNSFLNGSFISIFLNEYPNFREIKRLKLPPEHVISIKYVGDNRLVIGGLKGLYSLNLQNYKINEIYKPSESEYITFMEMKNGDLIFLVYNESERISPFRILKLEYNPFKNSYLKVSEIKLDITPILSISFDEHILIGSEKGLYLVG
ncbi:MAG TPA: hypothetical protein EYP30_08610 [Archaeoglobaceae archaeon]|nr:hypothetical protein [Archaeoglobaceae archaeon]